MAWNVIRNILVFLAWTVTSFLCHHFAKTFMSLSSSSIVATLIITACQLVYCSMNLNTAHDVSDVNTNLVLIAGAAHILATFATNYSMSVLQASSTMAIKMLEPISSAIIQRLVLQTRIQITTLLSLPIIVTGVTMFTGNTFQDLIFSKSVLIAMVSNICLGVRNIAMKGAYDDKQQLIIKSYLATLTFGVLAAILGTVVYTYGYRHIAVQIMAITVSSLCHAMYTYLSVALVLKSVSVITHAVLNIWKRVIVVLLLCAFSTRVLIYINFLGLGLAAAGLGIYVYGKHKSGAQIRASFSDYTNSERIKYYLTTVLKVNLVICMVGIGHNVSLIKQLQIVQFKNFSVYKHSVITSDKFVYFTKANTNSERIAGYPYNTNVKALQVSTIPEVIAAQQDVLLRLFDQQIAEYPYVMILDFPDYENKGDSAIGIGELMLLRKLNKKLIYYCTYGCNPNNTLIEAMAIANKYGSNKVVLLCQGGGNLVGWPLFDRIRVRLFSAFRSFKIIVFPQGIWINENAAAHLDYCRNMYARFPNVTLILRDVQSLKRAQMHFPKNNLLLGPDSAFQIGSMPRTIVPSYDIMWIKRTDNASSNYNTSAINRFDLKIKFGDWLEWQPYWEGSIIDKMTIRTHNGLVFIQQGRVLITDRLHGHILATLLHMPHVLLDTNYNKLAAYHNTWTKGLEGDTVLTARTPQEAVDKARVLLTRFNQQLPRLIV